MSAVIEVDRVGTRFGDVVVHEDLSLSVNRGEIFALAGGSGSGKTTLLHEIVMLKRPTSGSVRILGVDAWTSGDSGRDALRQRFGVMFQHGALFSSLTVAENVAFPLREHTRLPAGLVREIAEVKIGLVGLPSGSGSRLPGQISGGMIKRAAVARAIALDPEILLLDEPSAGLDPESAEGLDELVLSLRKLLGLTIVVVTHDIDLLWRVADRVAVVGDGRVRGVGTMEELAESDDPVVAHYFHGPRGRAAGSGAWKRK